MNKEIYYEPEFTTNRSLFTPMRKKFEIPIFTYKTEFYDSVGTLREFPLLEWR